MQNQFDYETKIQKIFESAQVQRRHSYPQFQSMIPDWKKKYKSVLQSIEHDGYAVIPNFFTTKETSKTEPRLHNGNTTPSHQSKKLALTFWPFRPLHEYNPCKWP